MLKQVIILVEILISVYLSILFHEFGHFAVAKILRVKVDEFSIGGGRKLFSFTFRKTRYTLNAFISIVNRKISFGASGFCGISTLSYIKATKLKRILIVSGGVLVNFILFVIFILYYMMISKNKMIEALALVNLLFVVYSLFPKQGNDIYRVVKLLKGNKFKAMKLKLNRNFAGRDKFKKL